MRVKIAYGVDIEDVPKELAVLFDFVYEKKIKLENQIDFVEKLLEEEELDSALEVMMKIRGSLAEMDSRVDDVSRITKGMIDYRIEQEQIKEQESKILEDLVEKSEGERNVSERGPFVDSTEYSATQE